MPTRCLSDQNMTYISRYLVCSAITLRLQTYNSPALTYIASFEVVTRVERRVLVTTHKNITTFS